MESPAVTLRFYGDLGALARGTDRYGEVDVPIGHPRTVKDAIESCGIPHTEVDLVLIDGESAPFDRLVGAGQRVSVFPPFTTLPIAAVSRVRPPPPAEPRFVLDVHLGRLTERLRLLGFDSWYRNDADDRHLADVSVRESRWLLTRDRGLLMRAVIVHGYLVRATDPSRQATEVLRRFGLRNAINPNSRCARCNGALAAVAKADVVERLEPGTRARHDEFVACQACGQVYWEGSHSAALRTFVAEARRA